MVCNSPTQPQPPPPSRPHQVSTQRSAKMGGVVSSLKHRILVFSTMYVVGLAPWAFGHNIGRSNPWLLLRRHPRLRSHCEGASSRQLRQLRRRLVSEKGGDRPRTGWSLAAVGGTINEAQHGRGSTQPKPAWRDRPRGQPPGQR